MYQIENSGDLIKSKRNLITARLTWLTVSPTVLALGFTSLFTDVSSEMVSTTLPIYLATVLRLAPLQLGLIDGLYQGAAILVKIISGLFADRWQRHKEVAAVGYGLSAFTKLGLLLAGNSWGGLAGVTLIDRIGKGIRTAPRDAMIASTTPPDQLATAFGAHRAMDTAGAMLGPLIAAGILWFTASAYDAVFVVSFSFALIGLAVIISFVRNPVRTNPLENKRANFAEALKLLAEPRFRALLLVGSLLSLATLSDSLLHLTMQRKMNLSAGAFPLLYVVIAFIYMLLAVPFGRLADRVGRKRLFIIGYGFLGMAYAMVLLPGPGAAALVAYVLLFGLYYAATEGVLMALASSLLPEHLRTSGLSLFTTATGLARLLASVAFGATWGWLGASQAVWVFLIGLGFAIVIAIALLRKS